MKNYNGLKYQCFDLVFIIYVFVIVIPQFTLLSYYNYLVSILLLLLVLLLLILKSNNSFKKKLLYLSFSIGILLFIPIMLDKAVIFNRYFNLTFLVIPFYVFLYNSTFRNNMVNIKILKWIFIPYVYTTIATLFELRNNSYVSRAITSSIEENVDVILKGVSGYSLIYSCVLILPILHVYIKRIKRIRTKILFGCIYSITFLLILRSNFFTALIISILSFIMIELFGKLNIKRILILFIGLLYISFRNHFNIIMLDILMSILDQNSKTYNRLLELKNEILYGVQSSEVDSRSDVLFKSINKFFENVLFGDLINSGFYFDLNGIGQHSTIMDTFAIYGIFFGFIYLFILYYPLLYLFKLNSKYIVFIMGVIFTLTIFNNNITYSIALSLYFIFPSVLYYINNQHLFIKK